MRADRDGPAGAFGDPVFHQPEQPLSIATGRPPIVHGICGNYLIDPDSGEEVMMNDVRFLRAPTVFSQFYDAGYRVAMVTAKDKLRALLGAGLKFDEDRAPWRFPRSVRARPRRPRTASTTPADWLGMADVPEVYSSELSEFVFAAGVKLLREFKPDVMYLSTTDYVQHKYAPDAGGKVRWISTRCSTATWASWMRLGRRSWSPPITA